jgi:biopolymer transport protein ExbD/biopolymer transport protein TolR
MSMKTGGGSSASSPIPTVAGMEGQDVNSDINVTPMIDVMLVLLIIFMVITPAMAGYKAILPKAVMAGPDKEDKVTLGIDNQGRFWLEKSTPMAPIPEQQLTARLQQAYASRPEDHVLYLKADQGVQYSVVLTAIDAARNAGVRKIGAITEQPKKAANPK